MRSWKIVGGIAAVALVVGAFLGNWMNGMPGMGIPGFDNGASPPAPLASDTPTKPEDPVPPDDPQPMPDEATDSRILYVEVDGAGYRVAADKGLRPAEIGEIVELARERTGNIDGIRVRVKRQETSRYQAEVSLRDELIKAGIDKSAIHWLNGPPL